MARQIDGWLVLTPAGDTFGSGRLQIPIDVDGNRCSGRCEMCKVRLGSGSERERTLALSLSRGARE